MIQVKTYKTADDILHASIDEAKKHAERLKEQAMHNLRLDLARDLGISISQAFRVSDWIAHRVGDLAELLTLEDCIAVE